MSSAEKAAQTRVMAERLSERSARVEERLREARRSGAADDAHRQTVLLRRLRQRLDELRERALELDREAETEDPSQIPTYEELLGQPPEHEHDDHEGLEHR